MKTDTISKMPILRLIPVEQNTTSIISNINHTMVHQDPEVYMDPDERGVLGIYGYTIPLHNTVWNISVTQVRYGYTM
jgi:hypothetical protein